MDNIEKTIDNCNADFLKWVVDFHVKTTDYARNSGNSVTVLYERILSATVIERFIS